MVLNGDQIGTFTASNWKIYVKFARRTGGSIWSHYTYAYSGVLNTSDTV